MDLKNFALSATLFLFVVVLVFLPLPPTSDTVVGFLLANPFYLGLLGLWFGGRLLVVTAAHVRHRRRSPSVEGTDSLPTLSVIIPAYNEADVIEDVVDSVLEQAYPEAVEILIVDDGSTDETWEIIDRIAEAEPTVRAFTQENKGAGTAQNYALERARHEVIVKLDADTELFEGSLRSIVQPFTDPEVVAVGGNVQVRNKDESIWTRIQSFEYSLAMEMGRMFQSRLHHMLCISGAFGAFRREPLEQSGGWIADPRYGEDFEVTIRMHKYGKVWFMPDGIALTDAPPTFRSWWRQRFRWTVNGVRTIILHRRIIFNPQYGVAGIIGLPYKTAVLVLLVGRWTWILTSRIVTGSGITGTVAFFGVFLPVVLLAFMLVVGAVAALVFVYRGALGYLIYLPAYTFLYRPLHLFVRFVGALSILVVLIAKRFRALIDILTERAARGR